jgi:quercetin dioxygenase-like cupin family protein
MATSADRPQLRGLFCRLGYHGDYDWTPLPFPGVSNKVLLFDRVTGATMELARVEEGAEFPEHYHTTVQTLFLVSGRLRSGDRLIEPGTFNVIPAGELHGPFYAEEEAIQLKYFSAVPIYILRDGTTYIYREDGQTISAGKLDFAADIDAANFISG